MTTKAAGRVGLVGSGIIADVWVPALRAVGLEVTTVASRPGSTSVAPFAARHGIAGVADGWEAMFAEPAWDALVITTWPDGTPDILEAAMRLGVPVLVEKPVAWNTARHRRLLAQPHDQVIVGYNRRFYRSVQQARCEAQEGPPLLAQLVLPTDAPTPEAHDPTGRYMQQFYESVSAHGLDLARFVLGDLTVQAVQRVTAPSGNVVALGALLTTARGDVVQLSCPWGTAANYALTLSRVGRRFELLPFEIATAYEGMEVHPPSDEYPVRRYLPKPVERVALDGVDLQQKPGFVGQCRALAAMIAGERPPTPSPRSASSSPASPSAT